MEDLERTGKAIKTRNELVHKGENPPDNAGFLLKSLLTVTAKLLSGPTFRFPTSNPGNSIMPEERWEEITAKIFSET